MSELFCYIYLSYLGSPPPPDPDSLNIRCVSETLIVVWCYRNCRDIATLQRAFRHIPGLLDSAMSSLIETNIRPPEVEVRIYIHYTVNRSRFFSSEVARKVVCPDSFPELISSEFSEASSIKPRLYLEPGRL